LRDLRSVEPFVYEGLPYRVIFGPGRSAEAADAVRALGCKRALVLTTPGRQPAGARLAETLGDLAAGTFAEAAMHTPVEVTERALTVFAERGADCTVALGGGSATGLGKAMALRTDAPQIVIPTTYAGSEVTPNLGQTKDGVKTNTRDRKILPEVVIYDVELTLSLPPSVSAASGMNAIAHAVEALYARDRNPVTMMMAEEGLCALAEALPTIMSAPHDRPARTNAQYGAWLCGLCLGSPSMALHHKLCHVLGGTFDLPHAETHAILLPHATAYNAEATPDAMARLARALKADDPAAGLFALGRRLNIPAGLKDIGMPADGIDRAVELAVSAPYWNPRPLEPEAIRALITCAYEGESPPAVGLA
jgi:alcohol dehydrogenase class IV